MLNQLDIRKRDVLARTGIGNFGEHRLILPAVADTALLFPDLDGKFRHTNIPLSAPPVFAGKYMATGDTQPVLVHPAAGNGARSGDCVMVANWHTAFSDPKKYVEWLVILKEKIPPDTVCYAPAAALPSNVALLCYTGFDLFDFIGVDFKSSQGIFCTPEGGFSQDMMERGACGCAGCRNNDLFEHNRSALLREITLAGHFIRQGVLRDLADSRSRFCTGHVAIMRQLDSRYEFMEKRTPVARVNIMRANSAESLHRPEVRRFAGRLLSRYRPPDTDVAVLLPCSAKKPYSLSQTHRKYIRAINGRAHELIVTSPLGLVPRELETIYPAGHYDVPVTGYWDAEECSVASGIIAEYFMKNPYRRIITHLEGGALKVARMAAESAGITLEYSCMADPAGSASLARLYSALAGERRIKDNRLRGMILWQFGYEPDTRGIAVRGHFPEIFYSRDRVQLFSIDTGSGLLRPTFAGWDVIPAGYRVRIDDFVPEGDVLVPGVTGADPGIREGDEVLVAGRMALATGRAAMSSEEMESSRHGVAVRVRKIKKLDTQ